MKKFDPRILPYLGALVQAVLFALAGYKYFDLGYWGAGAGFGVGMLVNFSMAVASSKVSDVAKNRRRLSYLSLGGLFILSPVIICSSLGWSVANLSWSLAADLSIMLTGVIMGGSLVKKDEPQKPQAVAEKPAQRRSAKKPAKVSEIPCRYAGAGCDRSFASQNAANAHARTCGYKPTVAMPIDVSTKAGAK